MRFKSCIEKRWWVFFIFSSFFMSSPLLPAEEASIPYTSLENLYGDNNDVLNEFFPLNSYINFGFHPEAVDPNHKISTAERVQSEEALYDYVFSLLQPTSGDSVLEVGSGRGDGCVKLKARFDVTSIVGVDLIGEQIARATLRHKDLLAKDGSVSFLVGAAEKLPLPSNHFSKIYSIEAAQHFHSLKAFASECHRSLQSHGRVVIATFFAVDESALAALKGLMPINIGGVDNVKTVRDILEAFQGAGFNCSEIKTIGNSVFPFFDQWLSQQKTQDWGRLWATAWRKGLLEYYVLSFDKR